MVYCGSALLTMCHLAGFMQKRFSNGSFAAEDPADCSPNDKQKTRVCNLDSSNTVGFYEASSWEYSWFAPHDTAHLISLMGGNVSDLITSSPYHSVTAGARARDVILGTCRRRSLSDWITFSMLVISHLEMNPHSRCVLSSTRSTVQLTLHVIKCTDTNCIPLRERARELRRCRSKSCFYKL